MEIKATLNKPYTEEQRIDFIVKNNHTLGYEIREKYTGLEAWGNTAEEQAEVEKKARIDNLIAKLDALDLKAIRPMRAKEAGTATSEDLTRLADIEQQAYEIRQQIKELQGV